MPAGHHDQPDYSPPRGRAQRGRRSTVRHARAAGAPSDTCQSRRRAPPHPPATDVERVSPDPGTARASARHLPSAARSTSAGTGVHGRPVTRRPFAWQVGCRVPPANRPGFCPSPGPQPRLRFCHAQKHSSAASSSRRRRGVRRGGKAELQEVIHPDVRPSAGRVRGIFGNFRSVPGGHQTGISGEFAFRRGEKRGILPVKLQVWCRATTEGLHQRPFGRACVRRGANTSDCRRSARTRPAGCNGGAVFHVYPCAGPGDSAG
jgi:hypothetical protein